MTPARRAELSALLFELGGVAEQLLPACRPRELATLAASFARLGAASRRLMQLVLARCTLSMLLPQELAQLAWAVAKSEHNPDPAWVEELIAVTQQRMAAAAHRADPQQRGFSSSSSSTSSSSSSAGHGSDGRATSDRRADFRAAVLKPQELSALAWSLAVLQRRCAHLLHTAPGGGARCARVGAGWFDQLRAAVAAGLGGYSPADVSMTLWALAALGHAAPRAWVDEVAARAAAVAPRMEEQHVATTLWALSRMQLSGGRRAPAAGGGGGDSSRRLPGCGSAAAAAPPPSGPSPEAAAMLCAALQRRTLALLPTMRRPVLNCVHVLAAHARMGVAPPPEFVEPLLRRMRDAIVEGAEGMGPLPASAAEAAARQEEEMCWEPAEAEHDELAPGGGALARLQAHTAHATARAAARRRGRPRGWCPRDLATAVWALAALGYRPGGGWAAAVTGAAARVLHTFDGRELSLFAYSLVRLGRPPPKEFLAGAVRVALMHPSPYNAQSSALLIWALARASRAARYRPGPKQAAALLQLFVSRADDSAAGVAQNVATVLHSLPAVIRPWHLQRMPAGDRHGAGAELLARLAGVSESLMADCGAAELVQLALGFSWLWFDPGAGWAAAHANRAAEVCRGLAPEQRALVAEARAVLMATRRQLKREARGREGRGGRGVFSSHISYRSYRTSRSPSSSGRSRLAGVLFAPAGMTKAEARAGLLPSPQKSIV
jgi:hypothetical protein